MVSSLIYRETLGLYVAKSILQSYDHMLLRKCLFQCVAHIHMAKDVTSP